MIWENAYILWGTTNGVPNIIEIIPETAGQYTGISDKNNAKIFHGDILKTHSGLVGRISFGSFDDDEAGFCGYGWFWDGLDREGRQYLLGLDPVWGGHEIIGNVYDHPELLKLVEA